MQKKKLLRAAVLVLAVIILAGAGFFATVFIDHKNNSDVLNISLTDKTGLTGSSANLFPGDSRTLNFSIQNDGYSPAKIRETVVVSVYNAAGEPVHLEGTSTTQAAFDICTEPQAAPLYDSTAAPWTSSVYKKVLQDNQAIYKTEYELEAAPSRFSNTVNAAAAHSGSFDIVMAASAAEKYYDFIVKVDVIFEGQVLPLASAWEQVGTLSYIFADSTANSSGITSAPAALPVLDHTTSFLWQVEGQTAYLMGIGSIQAADIIIPAQVSLSNINGMWVEDPFNGTEYNVEVWGDAFYRCDTIETVVFADGAKVANNEMNDVLDGMFYECTNLTAVYNIPDSVTAMYSTFKNCVSLVTVDALPEGVTNLCGCFSGCTDLVEAPEIPATVTEMTKAFYNCSALVTAPAVPDSVTQMTECFQNCTALVTVPRLSASVVDMTKVFLQCSSLINVPDIPTGVVNMSFCFAYCTSLVNAPAIPEGVTTMVRTFAYCTSLAGAPTLPPTVMDLSYCFYECSSMEGTVVIPRSVACAAPFKCEEDDKIGTGFMWFYSTVDSSISPLQDTFTGCISLVELKAEACPNGEVVSTYVENIPITYSEHISNGICYGCNRVNGYYEVDGMSIFMDNVPIWEYEACIIYLDNVIPDEIKDCCSRFTYTNDLGKYSRKYSDNIYGGFALFPSGRAYARYWEIETLTQGSRYSSPRYVIAHELAHCYDHNYSTYGRFSSSSEWRVLHAEEGQTIAEKYYCQDMYTGYSATEKRKETFAMAVGCYFSTTEEVEWLQQNCPGMYEYVDNLFGT